MQKPPPKRQIIKTRSQQPYVFARIVLVVLVMAALIALGMLFLRRQHAAFAGETSYGAVVRQEAPFAHRKLVNQASLPPTHLIPAQLIPHDEDIH